ncbi:hypothetical protein PF005_g22123 [Phytophthora fragariae]|uniref:Uncharacterized protein n=2 Tax=Phytophthora TaxID=4783 RepID=A0A6A4C062_9STRA|nr:hypothetical protein PF003_g13939 [Phytophthora fragariae]KAE9001266.1 hypothetical protein PR001_g18570 [Phytophthora rubi]KAE8931028.1 hypothetical protein PF009_g18900 [Phytophthora fragariae]KAE8981211.1 hypothetical protein PF011_g22119 [Phytophthora fragariae]KAE9083980.1 hypothetical protein PF010_g21018 [Phytophthora fragariae]
MSLTEEAAALSVCSAVVAAANAGALAIEKKAKSL